MRETQVLPFAAVIVTGGSSGIGKSFISHVRKVDRAVLICNLSRRIPEPSGEELKLRHIAVDLTDHRSRRAALEELLGILRTEVRPGPVLLINNAGAGGFGPFPQGDLAGQLRLIELNVGAVVEITGTLLPELRARGGAIINVASVVAFQPNPLMATYGATKAFILHWSYGLRHELRGSGIRVLTVCPGSTRTEFHDRAGLQRDGLGERFSQSSDQVVAEAWRALCGRRDRGHVVTGWWNWVQCAVAARLPLAWSTRISAKVLSQFRPRAEAGE